MLEKIKLENILFLDIETVPEHADFNTLAENSKELWAQKTKYKRKEEFSPEEFYNRAGIWAEFGKIICISVGYFVMDKSSRSFRITSFSGGEQKLLLDFKGLLDMHFFKSYHLLCAHNGKEFDFFYCWPQYLKIVSAPSLIMGTFVYGISSSMKSHSIHYRELSKTCKHQIGQILVN